VFFVDRQTYYNAVRIYLERAYPDITPIQRFSKLSLMDNPGFWDDNQPPSEYRWGCYLNSHMKIKIKNDKLTVFTNSIQDSEKVRSICEYLKNKIEKEWEAEGLPVHY